MRLALEEDVAVAIEPGQDAAAARTRDVKAAGQPGGDSATAAETEVLAPPRLAGMVEAENQVGWHRVGEEELLLLLIERYPPAKREGTVAPSERSDLGHPLVDVPARQGGFPRRLLPLVHRPR